MAKMTPVLRQVARGGDQVSEDSMEVSFGSCWGYLAV